MLKTRIIAAEYAITRIVLVGLGCIVGASATAQIVNPDTVPDVPRTVEPVRVSVAQEGGEATVAPRVRPAPGLYVGIVELLPYHMDPDARIFFTLDGSTPTTESTEYLPRLRGSLEFFAPIPIRDAATLKMIAVSDGKAPSSVVSFSYDVAVSPPETIYGSGPYRELPRRLVLRTATPGADIHYTLDGSAPDRGSPRYDGPLDLARLTPPVTVSALAVKEGMPDSPIAHLVYSVDPVLAVLTDEASIPAVIAAMTDSEKALLLTGTGTEIGSAGASNAIPRLNITSLELADGPAGIRLGGRFATAFPNPMLLAATWNTGLLREVGKAIGTETAYYGADIILGPGMNIHRDPLAGRVFEYYSEDPYLTGQLAGAWSTGAQQAGVGATLKHYAVNQYENNRRTLNVIVSERALREIYLKPFELAIRESDPRSIMASYNLVNNVHASEHRYLLLDMLRDTFGFTGFVMADWGAYHDARSSYSNGLDLNTPGGNLFGGMLGGPDITVDEITRHHVSAADVDRALRNILAAVVKSQSFRRQIYDRSEFTGRTELTETLKQAGNALSRRAASEGVVLLKNAGTALPLAEGTKAAVAGSYARDEFLESGSMWDAPTKGIIFQGGGSARVTVDPDDVVSLVEGLQNGGIEVLQPDNLVEGLARRDADEAAAQTDVGIVLIGRPGQENTDNTSIDLTDDEIAMIENMAAAYHALGKKVVVLLNVAHPIVTATWEAQVDAILYIGLPGIYGSNVVADILIGRVNPSGKTTDSWPRRHEDLAYLGAPPTTSDVEISYSEGVFVGYRHFDRSTASALYPFGHGLSYTTFEYADIETSAQELGTGDNDSIVVSVRVTNSGRAGGQEIAQLYVSAPDSRIERPVKELRGFAKTRFLSPGESQRLTFELRPGDLAYFDEFSGDWVTVPGRYEVIVGGTSDAAVLARDGIRAQIVVADN